MACFEETGRPSDGLWALCKSFREQLQARVNRPALVYQAHYFHAQEELTLRCYEGIKEVMIDGLKANPADFMPSHVWPSSVGKVESSFPSSYAASNGTTYELDDFKIQTETNVYAPTMHIWTWRNQLEASAVCDFAGLEFDFDQSGITFAKEHYAEAFIAGLQAKCYRYLYSIANVDDK